MYDWTGIWARDSQLLPRGVEWSIWVVLAGRGFGKLLDVETPIPTPTGWSRLGDMSIGDQLFDESGRICRIVKTFDGTPGAAYRLTFSDGATIDACGEHQWVTWTHAERKAFLRSPYEDPRRFPDEWPSWRLRRRASNKNSAPGPTVRTTEEIVRTFTYGKRRDLNHCIPVTQALQLDQRKLSVEPYVLGVWLGNGSARDGTIYAHQDDHEHLRSEFERLGVRCSSRANIQSFGTNGLTAALRELGVLQNKHVPSAYLRASADQRLDLLRGLMDSDGTASSNGYVEFGNTNPTLVKAVVELARSLGQKPIVSETRARLEGRDCGPFWRARWTPTIQVFALPRKQRRLTFSEKQSLRNHHRMIVSIERIESKPMRCLTVDSAHSMFLAGEAMIPTHNTRCGAESVRALVESGEVGRIGLISPTSADARDTLVEGESGILAVSPPWFRPKYEPSKRRLTWPNGARATLFSAEEPERTRGPQHDLLWGDEPASWTSEEIWDNALMGLRLGKKPKAIVTGTPKPVPLILRLLKDPRVVVTKGNTFENSGNLAPDFIAMMRRTYEGTRMGRQELYAEVLTDMPGALFSQQLIDSARVPFAPQLNRVVISVDPSPTSESGSDETGIMAVGVGEGPDGSTAKGLHAYVLKDHSLKGSPDEWARAAIKAFYEHQADCIIAEINNGGEMVESVLRSVDPSVPFKPVRAMRGKAKRAEPVAALYEQQRVHHVGRIDEFQKLERQMRIFTGINGKRDDRTDSMCWGVHELLVQGSFVGFV